MKTAEDYIKSRMDEHNIRHLVDQLDPIYQGELIALMQSYAHEHAIEFPSDKEIERIRQLGKEKYTIGSLSQSAYSEGFMDAVAWFSRIIKWIESKE